MGKRVIWVVIDSVGIGEEPDADKYGDVGSDTLGHIMSHYKDVNFKNMCSLGLKAIEGTSIYDETTKSSVIGCYGRGRELSNGKDTTTGHWEMVGIHTKNPFPTYPNGFPDEIINEFIEKSGCKNIYGNKVASGVPIIQEYGPMHMETGYPIVYTSADSVFQIAASEEKVGVQRLYEMCQIARDMLQGEHGVGRVIARPFVKENDQFVRTSNRKDFALNPDKDNVLVHLREHDVHVAAVGKISDIFNGVGIEQEVHTTGNTHGMLETEKYMETINSGLIFTNLVDFDMVYGHRRDVLGYKNALEVFDEWLGNIIPKLNEDDILIINADHGCDPSFKGSDHTREYIPVLVYGKKLKKGYDLGTLPTFADIGRTVLDYLVGDVANTDMIGTSFLNKIM